MNFLKLGSRLLIKMSYPWFLFSFRELAGDNELKINQSEKSSSVDDNLKETRKTSRSRLKREFLFRSISHKLKKSQNITTNN